MNNTTTAVREISRSEIELPLNPGDINEDVWLEYGWTTNNPQGSDNMLWYNEGMLNQIGNWSRALCQKVMTNEPKGEMYFLMRSRGVEHRIIVGD